MRPRDNTFVQEIQSPAAPDAATHDEIDFALAKQQENHRDAIALIREAHAIQVASLEKEIERLKADVLHILNTLDMPAGEHHERFRAGWATAIGQMSARIQALPSGLLSFDTRSEHGGSGGPHMIASLTGPLPHLWPVGLKTQTDVYSCE